MSLKNLVQIDKDARDYGFEWPDRQMLIDQLNDEIREVLEAIDNQEGDARVQEELGDLIHCVISLVDFLGYDVDTIIQNTENKFSKRMAALKVIALRSGYKSLHGVSIEEVLEFWRKAKVQTDDYEIKQC